MLKKLPVGIQSFEKIINSHYLYIDKTKIILDLINSGEFYFISRPRRFGKSLLLSTIQAIFSGRQELFKGLYIEDQLHWINYPIIYIDFSVIAHNSPDILEKSIHSLLDNMAEENDIILKSEFVGEKFAEYIKKTYQKNNSKVVVLMDEYDKAIIDHINDIDTANKNREILRDFFGVLKHADPYLRFVLLTGVSRFSKVSVFSGLNNLKDITFTPQFATIMGITENELDYYFHDFKTDFSANSDYSQAELANKIRKWYNGYSWNGKDYVYNPFSILNFFIDKQFSNYWFASGTPSFLINLLKEEKIEPIKLENKKLAEIAFEHYDVNDLDIYALLFQTGYITIKKITEEEEIREYTLDYPNFEVKNAFITYILQSFIEVRKGEIQTTILQLKKLLKTEKTSDFLTIIKAVFAQIPSILHIEKEAYYHSLFYMIATLMGMELELEVITDKGRIDCVLEFENLIYLIEFKYGQDKLKMEQLLNKGLDQIKERQYYQRYLAKEKKIVLLAIAFAGKEIDLKKETYIKMDMK